MIKVIFACDDEGGIGKDNALPWPKNQEDLDWFKKNTQGHVVIMGSKTWFSQGMPKPLPGRINVVVTNKKNPSIYKADRIIQGPEIDRQIAEISESMAGLDIWVIGGAQLIENILHIVEEIYITRIPGVYNCDTFVTLESAVGDFFCDEEHSGESCKFEIWRRV